MKVYTEVEVKNEVEEITYEGVDPDVSLSLCAALS